MFIQATNKGLSKSVRFDNDENSILLVYKALDIPAPPLSSEAGCCRIRSVRMAKFFAGKKDGNSATLRNLPVIKLRLDGKGNDK